MIRVLFSGEWGVGRLHCSVLVLIPVLYLAFVGRDCWLSVIFTDSTESCGGFETCCFVWACLLCVCTLDLDVVGLGGGRWKYILITLDLVAMGPARQRWVQWNNIILWINERYLAVQTIFSFLCTCSRKLLA